MPENPLGALWLSRDFLHKTYIKKTERMGNYVVTVSRECGSGGRTIARKLGEKLGLKVYDREFLNAVAEQFGLTKEEMDRVKAQKPNWWNDFCRFYLQFGAAAGINSETREATPMSLYVAEKKLLHEVAEKESFIVVGRSGLLAFRDDPKAFHLLIVADKDARVKRISEKRHLGADEARQLVERIDEERETFTHTVADLSRYDVRNYDLVINVTGMESDQVADLVAKHIELKFGGKRA